MFTEIYTQLWPEVLGPEVDRLATLHTNARMIGSWPSGSRATPMASRPRSRLQSLGRALPGRPCSRAGGSLRQATRGKRTDHSRGGRAQRGALRADFEEVSGRLRRRKPAGVGRLHSTEEASSNAEQHRRRRWWREGGRSRGGQVATHAPDTAPDKACHRSNAPTDRSCMGTPYPEGRSRVT